MAWRDDFDLPEDHIYLNCAYMGPSLKSTVEIGKDGVGKKARPWTFSTDAFFEIVEQSRSLCGQLIGTSAENVAIIPSVSYGLATVANFFNYEEDDEILILAEQFPSNVYVWMEKAKKYGAKIVTVDRPENDDWTAAVIEALSSKTTVAALPPCHWSDGSLLDLFKVKEALMNVNPDAKLVVDGSQYIGGTPFDAGKLQADAVVNVGYKWLLGPYSTCFLYVDDQYFDRDPLEFNWINRKNAEDFAGLVDYRSEYAEGARRFDMGEKSNFISLPMFTDSLHWILKQGVEQVSAHNKKLVSLLVESCDPEKVEAVAPDHRAQHFTGLRLRSLDTGKVMETLKKQQIYVSLRGDAMRISPYLYNTENEILRLANVINDT